MDEIAPGIWRWTARHPEWHTRVEWGHEVACFALAGEGLVLVDPQLPPPDAPTRSEIDGALERLARKASRLDIMITIPYHTRSAEELLRRYRDDLPTTLWGHAACAKRFTDAATVLHEIEPGGQAGEVATALPIGKPRRQEMPLYFPRQRALAFGDTVIGIDGVLRVWQPAPFTPDWYEGAFVPTLRPLLDLDVERVLVTHGPAVLHDGRRALADALAAGAWDYRTPKV